MMRPAPGQYLYVGTDDAYDEQGTSFGTATAAIAWLQEPGRDPRKKRRLFLVKVGSVIEQRLVAPVAYLDDIEPGD